MEPPAAMLTPKEVAKRIGMSVTFVRLELRRRALSGVKIGSTWRVPAADVDAYLAARRNDQPPSPPAA